MGRLHLSVAPPKLPAFPNHSPTSRAFAARTAIPNPSPPHGLPASQTSLQPPSNSHLPLPLSLTPPRPSSPPSPASSRSPAPLPASPDRLPDRSLSQSTTFSPGRSPFSPPAARLRSFLERSAELPAFPNLSPTSRSFPPLRLLPTLPALQHLSPAFLSPLAPLPVLSPSPRSRTPPSLPFSQSVPSPSPSLLTVRPFSENRLRPRTGWHCATSPAQKKARSGSPAPCRFLFQAIASIP